MWERFSFYGMRALLVLYLVNHLRFERDDALQIYALYTGFAYLTPLLGGLVADRYLGSRNAVIVGGVLMAIGHFAMAFESLLYLALGLIAFGNGFFKPNISAMVGGLYPAGDARRDGAYTIFYMGINLGALFSPIICGTLGQRLGWHWGFSAAGVGMLIGLGWFLRRQDTLGDVGRPPRRERESNDIQADSKLTREEWWQIWWIGLITLSLLIFIVGFEQAGGTVNLFADEKTDLTFLGFSFPSSWFQSVNPLIIIFLAPLFDRFWRRFDANFPGLSKQGWGLLVLGVGFLLMWQAELQAADGLVSPLWLLGFYLFATTGELCISPVGLSMVHKLSPPRLVGLMMAVFLAGMFAANYLAGTLEATLAFVQTHYGIELNLWVFLAVLEISAGVLFLLYGRHMGGEK